MVRGRRLLALLMMGAVPMAGVVLPSATSPAAALTPGVGFTADALSTYQTNGIVWAMAQAQGTVFVGGTFSAVRPAGSAAGTNEVARTNFVALDTATGAPTSCQLSFTGLSGTVRALAVSPDGSTLYAGGSFSAVNGTPHFNLAAINIATCAPISTFAVAPNATVRALAASATAVYFGGDFQSVDGSSRGRLAAASTSGSLLAWAPAADLPARAIALTPDGANVAIGGDFNTVNAADSHALAVVGASSGTITRAYPLGFISASSVVKSLYADNTGIYAGNEGTGGGVFDGRFALNLNDFSERWRDTCLGATQVVLADGDNVYAGSHAHDCSSMGGFPDGRRQHLTVEGINDPHLLVWWPDTNGGIGEQVGPRTMAISAKNGRRYLWVGGEFTTVNGVAQQGLLRLADGPDTGAPSIPSGLSTSNLIRGSVQVRWAASTDRDDTTLTYQVYRNGSTTPLGSVTANSDWWKRPQVSFTDTTVTPGTSYTYRVRANDSSGNTSSLSAGVTVVATQTTYAYPTKVLGDGANLYWRYNETSGSPLRDESTGGGAGVLVGTRTQGVSPGAVGNDPSTAITFDGSTSFGARSSAIPSPTTYSVETWFKTTTTSGGKLVGFGDRNTGLSTSYDRHVYMLGDGRLVYGVWVGNAATVTSRSAYNDGQWHQVVASQDSTGMSLYVDGVRVGINGTATSESYTGFWRVGGDNLDGWPNQPTSSSFAGSIDETAVYPTALSGDQVAAHYRASGRTPADTVALSDSYGKAVTADQPSLFWRLGESSGTVAEDSSGNAQRGDYEPLVTHSTASAIGTSNGSATVPGTNDNSHIGLQTQVSSPTSFSGEIWFRTRTTQGGKLFGFGDAKSGVSTSYDKHVYLADNGQLLFGTYNGNADVAVSPRSYNDGQWHHVVATQGASGLTLYVDGASVASNAGATANQLYAGYWRLGGDNLSGWPQQPSSGNFAGDLDEFAIYPYAVPGDRVLAHYRVVVPAADSTPPSAPTALRATVSGSDVTLTWTASTDDTGVTGYRVYRSATSGFTPAAADKVAEVTGTSYTDPARPAGTAYYRVIAVDAAANASAPSDQAAATVPDTQAPSVPGSLTTTVSGSDVTLTWAASTDDTGVTGYRVYRSATSGFTPAAADKVADVTGTSYTDPARPAGTAYYRVIAVDAAANASAPSDQASATVAGAPADPVTQTLTPTADTYANQAAASSNYGTAASMASRGGTSAYVGYLRFALPPAPSGLVLKSATLGLRTTSDSFAGSIDDHQVRLGTSGWTEAGLTWANRPPATGTLVGAVSGATSISTAYSTALSTVALAPAAGQDLNLTVQGTGADNLWFWTRSATAAYRPSLVLVYGAP